MKLPLFILLFVLHWPFSVNGQVQLTCAYTLDGRIMDMEHNPLPGATIQLVELAKGTISNEEGFFKITGLCEGSYTLVVSFIGYKPYEQKIKVKRSESIHIDLETDETLLSEIVVQEHYNHISKSQTSSALSGTSLEAARGKALGAALKSIAGVNTIQAGPAIFKPVIHGVHSQRILMLNNGIRHEGQQWGAEHAPEIDAFLASNIVVVKDASAIKYGADALGGVVIVNPAELPTEQGIGGTVFSSFQTNGRGGTLAGMLEGASKKISGLSWRTHGSHKQVGDYHTPTYSLTNTGFRETNFSAAARYHPSETSGVEIFFSHFNSETGLLKGSSVSSISDLQNAYEADVPAYTKEFSYTISSPRQEVAHNLVKATGHIHKNENTFSTQYALQFNKRKEFQLRRGDLINVPTLDLELTTHTIDAEWEREKSENQIRCIGINGMLQQNRNVPGTQTIPFVPNFSNYSFGGYFIQKAKLKQWHVEAGARFDYRYYTVAGRDYTNAVYQATLNFANVSATLGFMRPIGKQSRFTSGLSSAWRPPHVAELYSIGTHQSAVAIESGLLIDDDNSQVQSPESVDFKNEKALKWVNTYLYSGSSSQIEVSGYANYISNYIYLKPEGVTRLYPYFHYRQTNALFTGIDLRAEQKLNRQLSAKLSASILHAADVDNKDVFIYIPSNRAEMSLHYETSLAHTAINKFFIEAGTNFVARQYRAPRVISIQQLMEASEQGIDLFETDDRAFDFTRAPDAYWLVQASAGLSLNINEQKLDIRLSGDNLLNTRYREYTNRLRYFANETGRNMSLSISYNF